jgi:glycosyltransferase involved in cell wall biosynthesis
VEVSRYRVKTEHGSHDPPRLVWIGSRDNVRLLDLVARPLLELHRVTGARLTVIGDPEVRSPLLGPMVDVVAWSEQVQHDALADADVGIMPLEDDPYSRGKCGYKLLQYSAAGLPSVGSPVGTNASILRSLGQAGATGPDEWYDALAALLAAPAERRAELGRTARARVESEFSFDSWETRWLEAVGLDRTAGGAS